MRWCQGVRFGLGVRRPGAEEQSSAAHRLVNYFGYVVVLKKCYSNGQGVRCHWSSVLNLGRIYGTVQRQLDSVDHNVDIMKQSCKAGYLLITFNLVL